MWKVSGSRSLLKAEVVTEVLKNWQEVGEKLMSKHSIALSPWALRISCWLRGIQITKGGTILSCLGRVVRHFEKQNLNVYVLTLP